MNAQERFEELLGKVQHDCAEWGSAVPTYTIKDDVAYIVLDDRDAYGDGCVCLWAVPKKGWKEILKQHEVDEDDFGSWFSSNLNQYLIGELE